MEAKAVTIELNESLRFSSNPTEALTLDSRSFRRSFWLSSRNNDTDR